MHPIRPFLSAAIAGLFIATPDVHAAFPAVALKPVVLQQIHSPTTITFAPDASGRLFVCDQLGKIYIIKNGAMLPTPFLNIANPANTPASNAGPGPVVPLSASYDERGLLGLAFHPGFANPLSPGYRKFYVNYNKDYSVGTDPAPPQVGDPVNCVTVISEFEVSPTDPDVALVGSERRVLAFTQPQFNHNGGQLEFGPDGLLYIGSGDGGSGDDNNAGHTGGSSVAPRPTNGLGNSLDRTRYLGKILRIDPLDPDGGGALTYSIPASNPFFNDPTPNLKKEIYAEGLRNPWKFSFDKRPGGTNRLFCGDVGQRRIEEINLIVSGGNYGWRFKEGTEAPTFSSGATTNPMPDPGTGPYLDPIAQYAHTGVNYTPPGGSGPLPQLGVSVTGGFVYRGAEIPAMQGKYVFGDYGAIGFTVDGRLMGLEETAPGSGVFTLTQAIPLVGLANPIVGQRLLCMGEDSDGEIYVGLKSNNGVLQTSGGFPAGGIYKIVPPAAVVTTLLPFKDNTMFSESGALSNGQGFLFSGRTLGTGGVGTRRALLAFDVAAALPAGTVVSDATLTLNMNRSASALGKDIALHRVTENWGEGASNAGDPGGLGAAAATGDATWTARFYDANAPGNSTNWTTPGGSYNAVASATTNVSFNLQDYVWNSPQLAADVQAWLNTPATNYGWIMINNETELSARRFDSAETGGESLGPRLALTYITTPPLTRRETWLQTYFLVGQYVDDSGDLEGDTYVNLVEYAFGFSPKAANAPGDGIQASSVEVDTDTVFTINFRRDPRATDLTYILQTSSDLVNWNDIAESAGGADPTGTGYFGEGDIVGEEPMRLVTAQETLPTATNPTRFVRLRVNRAP